jgi:hypothetical protein
MTEPAFAHSIATANASLRDATRALVVIAMDDQGSRDIATNVPP